MISVEYYFPYPIPPNIWGKSVLNSDIKIDCLFILWTLAAQTPSFWDYTVDTESTV